MKVQKKKRRRNAYLFYESEIERINVFTLSNRIISQSTHMSDTFTHKQSREMNEQIERRRRRRNGWMDERRLVYYLACARLMK